MAAPFEFSEVQANHILDMQLARLTRLGRADLEEELAKLRETIAELEAILGDEGRLRGVIKTEMGAIRDEFATPRRAEITFDAGDMNAEDLIDDEELVITMTRAGYVKAVPASQLPDPGPRRAGRAGGQPARRRTWSPGSSTPAPTPTCCSSPTGARCTGCGPTRSRSRSARLGARPSSTCCPWRPTSASRP